MQLILQNPIDNKVISVNEKYNLIALFMILGPLGIFFMIILKQARIGFSLLLYSVVIGMMSTVFINPVGEEISRVFYMTVYYPIVAYVVYTSNRVRIKNYLYKGYIIKNKNVNPSDIKSTYENYKIPFIYFF